MAHVNEARRARESARRASLVAAMILLGEPPARASLEQLEDAVDLALGRPSQRLAVYGSLRRGERHHSELAEVEGRWSAGSVLGRLAERDGYPTLTADERASACAVELLESLALPVHWARLDAFEGAGYRRERVTVERADGSLCVANLYAFA
ncbi:MAG TPA: gamma-glutamylcyclotransferase family protein [Planctomycetota bacterium]|nr:gamma-glutamylcyclotransferase family protein [Planctomycetota bacterium]